MITQKDIAKILGISRATVARALRNDSSINAITKERVLKTVKEYNYEKNYIGSSLANMKEKKVLCLIVESYNEEYTNNLIKGINKAFNEIKSYNFVLDIRKININKPDDQIKILKNNLNKDIQGLIITPLDKESINKLIEPFKNKIKIVSLGLKLSDDITFVGPDYYKHGQIAGQLMSYILSKNEDILVIDNGDDKVSSYGYLNGFVSMIDKKKFNLIGPHKCDGIEDSVSFILELLKIKKIKGLFLNRYAQNVLIKLKKDILKDIVVITNGSSKLIKDLIKKKVIAATIMEEEIEEGYTACKILLESIYKDLPFEENVYLSKPRIILPENINDAI